MKLKVSVFEYLNQKVMYIQDVNYYFGIRDNFDIKLGDYELSEEEVLNIAKENDPEEYEIFINTSIEERINKINTYSIDDIKEQSSYGQFTLCLHPSRKCNLNCKYCFRESEYLGEQQLTFEVAKDAIDFLVDKYAPCASKYVVDLSGSGEPLLQMDLVKQIVDYCKQKRDEICKNIEVMFCTNLTLLTPEIVEYLDNEPSIILGTSIVGDQITNDNNRVYANGKGTYADIVKGLKMFKNKKLGLAVTITPLNQDVDLIYDYLYRLPNVDCVSMKFIRNFDGSKYDFDNFDISYLFSRYINLCKNIIKELCDGNFDYFEKLFKGGDYFGGIIYNNIVKSTYKIYRCDAGKSRITVDNKGDIFACSVMYGNECFKIGNIYTGIKEELQEKFEVVSVENEFLCKTCEINLNCGGECYANAYLKNSNIFSPIKKMCDLKVKLNRLCMTFLTLLRIVYQQSFIELVDYAFRVSGFESTRQDIWAIMTYLKLKGIQTNYDDILNKLNNYSNQIIGIIECIDEFLGKANLYKIDSISELLNMKSSLIIIKQTNNSLLQYEYYILKYKDYGKPIFQGMTILSDLCSDLELSQMVTDFDCFAIV